MKNQKSVMSVLYANIGYKVKCLAFMSCIVEAIGAIIGGIALLVDKQWWGIVVILAGPVAAWVTTWVLYAFGELVDKVSYVDPPMQKENIQEPKAHSDRVESKEQKQIASAEKKQRQQELKQQKSVYREQQRALKKDKFAQVPAKVKLATAMGAVIMGVLSVAILILAICLWSNNWLFAVSIGLVGVALLVMTIPVCYFVYNKCLATFKAAADREDA
jgi:ABC-type multidrug transport system fused ATPase/permease subunit